jgi:hypothetical protein
MTERRAGLKPGIEAQNGHRPLITHRTQINWGRLSHDVAQWILIGGLGVGTAIVAAVGCDLIINGGDNNLPPDIGESQPKPTPSLLQPPIYKP